MCTLVSDAATHLVCNERLHVDVAGGRDDGVAHGHLVQRAHGSKAQHGLGGGQEQL